MLEAKNERLALPLGRCANWTSFLQVLDQKFNLSSPQIARRATLSMESHKLTRLADVDLLSLTTRMLEYMCFLMVSGCQALCHPDLRKQQFVTSVLRRYFVIFPCWTH